VVGANKKENGIGGHISTFASAANLLEVGFNHFFRAKNDDHEGDLIYFQGHAAPGIYARAFLEGRISHEQMENFRRELKSEGGLSSYPHPWLMPNFWQFPTVSMGLAAITAIYQARFAHYLADRGLKERTDAKVWAFLGDGELDEPESLGAITLASREQLDNLIFVVNCNLQRLDGPVRGNGKIIQELEAAFHGAGWNVIKVIWGADWDPLLLADKSGLLIKRMGEVPDGQYQKYTVAGGEYIREDFFNAYSDVAELVKNYTDEQLAKLRRGGHDPAKVYAAYHAAVNHKGSPTVILAKTIKGYGLGEAGEGRNVTHQQKKLNEEELREFRSRFGIPLSDADVVQTPFYRPPDNSKEIEYLLERRHALGGFVPERKITASTFEPPDDNIFDEYMNGSDELELSTTMAVVHMLSKLLADKTVGKYVVPIVPDEARTFGMESLFRKFGIYSRLGQVYEPVDRETLLYYKEATDGQILEEGITEAGSMSSFIAAGTAYANYGLNMIPFFIYYSMFGFQRIGDLIWAAGDSRVKGFLVGGTAGRTTLSGEGLQHQDGQSHLLAYSVPNLKAYDPAFAYEMALIIRDGIKRMYVDGEDIFYYITAMNEFYKMPPMPDGVEEGVLRGIYRFKESSKKSTKIRAHLFGSGTILNEAIRAQEILEQKFDVAADVWSVTSYKELYHDAIESDRQNLFGNDSSREPFIARQLAGTKGVYIAASDYIKALPGSIGKWIPGPFYILGTDGFGRSDTRESLRDFFEVSAKHIVYAALKAMVQENKINYEILKTAAKELDIDFNQDSALFR
ncbi:MAG: pyruvate dehydrogenase (acetyl-transferring), homodimeric type, partial [Candidatus Zixiibacteriota bacterium]